MYYKFIYVNLFIILNVISWFHQIKIVTGQARLIRTWLFRSSTLFKVRKTSIGSSGRVGGGGAKNMKYVWPPLAAIFFMTCLYRAPSAPLLDPLLENISCLKCTVNSYFYLIQRKSLVMNDFELTVPDLHVHFQCVTTSFHITLCKFHIFCITMRRSHISKKLKKN